MPHLRRPLAREYAAILSAEIALVPDVADFAAMLRDNADVTRALAAGFGEAQAALRYAPGKWSVRETIGHLSDCERVLSYRLLRALRGDATLLPGFDHNAWVPAAQFERRTLADVVREFSAVRNATVALLDSAAAETFEFRLNVGTGHITGVALAYLIAGHELHHQGILRERYREPLSG
ncbi:MAG: DinB family protein [Gemmatimonadaceae bacterium]|nr:DinB family protein [Gemmatimonadaceae bacterium]